MRAFSQLLEKKYGGILDDEGRDYLKFVAEGAVRMNTLIDDLLAYASVGREPHGETPPVDCAVLLEEVKATLGAAITESGAQVTSGPLPSVPGVRASLAQLFQNLVENAIKFRNGKAPVVRMTAELCENGFRFAVQDNGIGIEPEHFGRIFQVFQRLHPRDMYPGSGLGLAICKKIVERHGGRIWLESKPGEGATFYFTLPT
jgi:light-regulated signal transduction histidine kinase (bacteriophytochrome)